MMGARPPPPVRRPTNNAAYAPGRVTVSSFESMLKDLETQMAVPSPPIRNRSVGPTGRDSDSDRSRSRSGPDSRLGVPRAPSSSLRPTSPGRSPSRASATGGSTSSSAAAAQSIDALLRNFSKLANDDDDDDDDAASTVHERRQPPGSNDRASSTPSSATERASAVLPLMASPAMSASSTSGRAPVALSPSMRTGSFSSDTSVGAEAVRRERERREQQLLERKKQEAERLKREQEAAARAAEEENRRITELRKKEDEEKARQKEAEKRQNKRRDLERLDADKRAETIERRVHAAVIARRTGEFVEKDPVDESVISTDFVHDLIHTLNEDDSISPTPEDFMSNEGFSMWQRYIGRPTTAILADLVKHRFIDQPAAEAAAIAANGGRRRSAPGMALEIFVKVVQARNLQSKEGRFREAFCRTEFGSMPDGDGRPPPVNWNPQVFVTEAVPSNNNPLWNQHMELKITDLNDCLVFSVWDRRKDYFLGKVRLGAADILSSAAHGGFASGWYKLGPREGRNKDKYVGGEIFLEISMDINRPPTQDEISRDPVAHLETQLLSCKINFKTLYRGLLRACLTLEMASRVVPATPPTLVQPSADDPDGAAAAAAVAAAAADLLSPASKAILKVWARKWVVGEAFE
ncbi:hypothetical protein HK405_011004, partial [Cladochytrium tenue]